MSDKSALSIRDRILDQLASDRTIGAIKIYRRATGESLTESKRIILRLKELLHTDRELSSEDQRFLDDFRDRLDSEPDGQAPEPIEPSHHRATRSTTPSTSDSEFDLLDQPHASWPKQLAALASYVLIAMVTLNLVGLVILSITGFIASFISLWLGFFLSLLLAGPMFIAFPGILRGLVVPRLGVGGFVRSPGFGWEIALGFTLVMGGILGSILSERMVWLLRSQVVEVPGPIYGAADNERIPESAILHIEPSSVLSRPFGVLVETRRDRHGSTSRSEFTVRPLIPGADSPPVHEIDGGHCWWLGHSNDGFGFMQHPILLHDDPSPYFVINPAHQGDYRKAVANALGHKAPDCALVLERVPDPQALRGALVKKSTHLALAVNGAFWALLAIWGIAWIYRRVRGKRPAVAAD